MGMRFREVSELKYFQVLARLSTHFPQEFGSVMALAVNLEITRLGSITASWLGKFYASYFLFIDD